MDTSRRDMAGIFAPFMIHEALPSGSHSCCFEGDAVCLEPGYEPDQEGMTL
jgi:hypothetical protein